MSKKAVKQFAIYSRKSKFTGKGESVENQVEMCRQFVGLHYGNDSALSAKVCLQQQSAYYTSPAFNGSSTARDQVGALLTKCLTMTGADLDAQIKAAFEDAVDECEYNS